MPPWVLSLPTPKEAVKEEVPPPKVRLYLVPILYIYILRRGLFVIYYTWNIIYIYTYIYIYIWCWCIRYYVFLLCIMYRHGFYWCFFYWDWKCLDPQIKTFIPVQAHWSYWAVCILSPVYRHHLRPHVDEAELIRPGPSCHIVVLKPAQLPHRSPKTEERSGYQMFRRLWCWCAFMPQSKCRIGKRRWLGKIGTTATKREERERENGKGGHEDSVEPLNP